MSESGRGNFDPSMSTDKHDLEDAEFKRSEEHRRTVERSDDFNAWVLKVSGKKLEEIPEGDWHDGLNQVVAHSSSIDAGFGMGDVLVGIGEKITNPDGSTSYPEYKKIKEYQLNEALGHLGEEHGYTYQDFQIQPEAKRNEAREARNKGEYYRTDSCLEAVTQALRDVMVKYVPESEDTDILFDLDGKVRVHLEDYVPRDGDDVYMPGDDYEHVIGMSDSGDMFTPHLNSKVTKMREVIQKIKDSAELHNKRSAGYDFGEIGLSYDEIRKVALKLFLEESK